MGRKTNESRRAWFAEFQAKEKLKEKPKPVKPRKKLVVQDEQSNCCLDRYKTLPEGFRPCIDCKKIVAKSANGQVSAKPATTGVDKQPPS